MLIVSGGLLLAWGRVVAASDPSVPSASPATQNANHIFNAVHSSMRQWGSSLHHNGMSVFVATVPEGTQLYHGTSHSERVNATEWLAFEPEHALVFARSRRPGFPPGRGHPPPGDGDRGREDWYSRENMPEDLRETPKQELKARHPHEPYERRPLSYTIGQSEPARASSQQMPLQDEPEEDATGYLHTYRVKHNLRLLYIDGQSAAKSTKGTLDMQDFVLLHNAQPDADSWPPPRSHDFFRAPPSEDGRPPPTGGVLNEGFRADHLCAMARTDWAGKIDGFLRMELGFEIILCSFEDGLDVERITLAKATNDPLGPGGITINYYRAVASRFDGIGGDRVRIDYDNFVTLYTFENAVSFTNDGLPRANNDTKVVTPILEAITNLALSASAAAEKDSPDWQAVADMVVSRYSDRIDYLTSGTIILNETDLKNEIEWAIRPYIDYNHRNKSLEIQRCATQYFPSLLPPSPTANNHNNHNHNDNDKYNTTTTAPRAILHVTTHLCAAFFSAAEQPSTEEAISTLRKLKQWLNWTTFKRCRTCKVNQVCFLPIWPAGGQEDFDHPKCVESLEEIGEGYWGDWWRPRLSSLPLGDR